MIENELENRIKELEIELSILKSDLIAGKQAEVALKESNDKLLSLSDNIIGDLAFVNINTLKYEFVNKLYEKSTGIPKDKIIGSHLKDIIGQTNYQSAINYIDEIKAGKPVSFENTFESITGKRWMQANYIPLADSNGHIISFAILSFDITDRKKNEEKLLFIIKAVESASYAIGISDAQGHHFYQNKALTDLFEYSTAEEMEAAGGGTIVISDPKVAKEMYGNIMSGRSWAGELEMVTKSGRVFPAFERTDAIKDSGGNVIGLIGVITEITDRKRTEEALKESETKLKQLNADKDLFISILAHDLKSPFNALLGLSELLVEDIRQYDIDEIENIAKNINTSARNSFNLLKDILMWARTQSGKMPFKLQNLCFEDICKDILENLKPNSDAKNITINYFPEKHINIHADINMLKTVLRNLVSNAIKFTNNDGTITISAEQTSSDIIISVSDNGIGIDPDELTKLFDISQIISTSGTADETGTGLGLLLCKEFVEKHSGKIWVVSEAGKGSNFKFTLPQCLNSLI